MRRAFTLIELLVVVSIIAVLASLVVVGFSRFRNAAKGVDTAQRLQAVITALGEYNGGEGSAVAWMQRNLPVGGAPTFATLNAIHQILLNPDTGGMAAGRADPADINSRTNQLGKKDLVQDVEPPRSGAVAAGWYEQTWPFCWPETDWDRAIPGSKPPILRFPWGRVGLRSNGAMTNPKLAATTIMNKALNAWAAFDPNGVGSSGIICKFNASATKTDAVSTPVTGKRSDGTPVSIEANLPPPFDAGWMSPLRTVEFLTAAGILDPVTGVDDFRSKRSPSKPWNDRWGNPLVISYALFQPERYYDSGKYPWYNNGSAWSNELIGQDRRDLLLKAAYTSYQFNRAIYLCSASVGPVRRSCAPSPEGAPIADWDGEQTLSSWNAADDAKVLRGLWLQVRSVTRAYDWTEKSWTSPAWSGVLKKKGVVSGEECYLSAPVELK